MPRRPTKPADLTHPDLQQSAIIYQGESLLSPGFAIVVIATGRSKNVKTGAMIQTWILLADRTPRDAVYAGEDHAICGDCTLRGDGTGAHRSCYVNLAWAPAGIYKAYTNDRYQTLTPFFAGHRLYPQANIRLGTYGDPAAVPTWVWRDLLTFAKGWTGYTHQWKVCDPTLKAFCMASVETLEEAYEAHTRGWRYFRIIGPTSQPTPQETLCPASAEAGHLTTCEHCTLCQGQRTTAKSIAIYPHGKHLTFWKSRQAVLL